MSKRLLSAAAAVAVVTVLALPAALALAKPATGPQTAKCGKLKKKAAKKRCLQQNKANRIAFNQIKNSLFVGERGDGDGVESTYCANGKFESRISDSYGTGVSTGRWWQIRNATVKRGGKWIDAFLRGPEGYEIGLQRRGSQWRYGIASFDRITEPGDVEKKNAAQACQALEV